MRVIARAAPLAVYTVLVAWSALTWLPTHDEGVTWRQAFGPVPLERGVPTAMASLRPWIGGRDAHAAADVLDAMMAPGGMHPPGYYLALRSWAGAFGASALAVAVPAWLLGCAGLVAFRRLARRLLDDDGLAGWTTLALAASPWLMAVATWARPYGVAVALFLVSSSLVPELRRPGRPGARLAFAGASALGLWSLYHYVFGLGLQALWVGLDAARERDGRGAARAALAFAAGGLAFAPWAPRLWRHLETTGQGDAYFRGVVPLAEWPLRGLELGLRFVQGEAAYTSDFATLAWSAAALGVVAVLLVRRAALPPSGLWLASAALPLALALADRLHGSRTLFVSKTAFALWPLALLWVGRAGRALPPRVGRAALALAASALLATSAGVLWRRAPAPDAVERHAAAIAAPGPTPHWVALASRMPGYAVPLLRALAAEGFDGTLVYAPVLDLDPLLERAAAAGVARLTLVDLAVDYGPAQRWGAPGLERLARRARERGWRVGDEPGEGPRLVVRSPARVCYLGF